RARRGDDGLIEENILAVHTQSTKQSHLRPERFQRSVNRARPALARPVQEIGLGDSQTAVVGREAEKSPAEANLGPGLQSHSRSSQFLESVQYVVRRADVGLRALGAYGYRPDPAFDVHTRSPLFTAWSPNSRAAS